jgi:hypothetical protein
MTQRLAERQRIDPVLSPLMQALVASSEAETSVQAMQALAAQALAQAMRRMQLPLHELPAELLHGVAALAGDAGQAARLVQDYREAGTRLGLMAALVSGMGLAGAVAGWRWNMRALPCLPPRWRWSARRIRAQTAIRRCWRCRMGSRRCWACACAPRG